MTKGSSRKEKGAPLPDSLTCPGAYRYRYNPALIQMGDPYSKMGRRSLLLLAWNVLFEGGLTRFPRWGRAPPPQKAASATPAHAPVAVVVCYYLDKLPWALRPTQANPVFHIEPVRQLFLRSSLEASPPHWWTTQKRLFTRLTELCFQDSSKVLGVGGHLSPTSHQGGGWWKRNFARPGISGICLILLSLWYY